MNDCENSTKKFKGAPSPEQLKNCILKTEEPLVLKNLLFWDLLKWSAGDWIDKLGHEKLDVRIGTKQCTKVPQWENNCTTVTASLKDLFDNASHEESGTWMYFDYKHMKRNFNHRQDFLEGLSWADFGFSDKGGKDSTIWIGTPGAYTPCHMDSYGCNIVAQVYGKKLWVLFPPSKTAKLRPTRVPYEESSVYSDVHFSCGLNVTEDLSGARVVELCPGDVLVVPRHWWHYVENLTTAVSINMWIPLESDHQSRLEESLVRFFIHSMVKVFDGETQLLNPDEMDLEDEPVDLRQISWCTEQMTMRSKSKTNDKTAVTDYEKDSCETSGAAVPVADPLTSNSCESSGAAVPVVDPLTSNSCVSNIPTLSSEELQCLLLKKCGCSKEIDDHCESNRKKHQKSRLLEQVINAYCHPDIVAKVAEVIVSMEKTS